MSEKNEKKETSVYLVTTDAYEGMTEILKRNPHQLNGTWYPTIEEIQKYIEPDLKENLEFLIWLINQEMELTMDEKETREYCEKLIEDNFIIAEKEVIDKVRQLSKNKRKEKKIE